MNKGDNNDDDEVEDPRLVFIYNYLIKAWKIKNDVIETMMRNPEFNVSINI